MSDAAMIATNLENGIEIPKEKITAMIFKMQAEMELMPQIETPLKHYFSKELYAREMTIPKGSLVVGKIHKFTSLSIISKGDISILSIDGVMRVKAPYTIVASPGAKRLVYAHEETVWTVIHATKETDLAKIEDEVIAKDYSEVVGNDQIETKEKPEAILCHGD